MRAQDFLQQKVQLNSQEQNLKSVLHSIEEQAGFVFAYNSQLLPTDSLVSLQVNQATVMQALHALFGSRFRYQQSGRHLIIMPTTKLGSEQLSWLTGQVVDESSGQPIAYASVFEPNQLVGTLTDEAGYFRLQIKGDIENSLLNVRKLSYADTIVSMNKQQPKPMRIGITQIAYAIDTVVILNNVERNWLASRLLTSRQIINSTNLSGFFARQALQVSLVPGLGTHGRMGAQVVNKFSLNVLGGYTAGVNGFELGSLFNIVKQDMQYAQLAGLFNIVGGDLNGVQVGGLYNSVRKEVNGIQVGGLVNVVYGDFSGIQVGGLYNKVKSLSGIQLSGIGSSSETNSYGISISGLFNHSQTMSGIQIAGIYNSNKNFNGLQVALVNLADTNQGYSIGLVNISKTGYHKVALAFDETQTLMLSYKSGNPKMYSVLGIGTQLNFQKKAFAIAYGLGSDLPIYRQQLFFNPELNHYFFFNGNWSKQNMLERLSLQLKYRISPKLAVYGGPSINVFYNKPGAVPDGYKPLIYPGGIDISKRVKAWLGYTIGFEVF